MSAHTRGVTSGQHAIQNPELTPESIEEACEHSIEHMPEGNEHFNPAAQIAFLHGRIAGAYGIEEEEDEL